MTLSPPPASRVTPDRSTHCSTERWCVLSLCLTPQSTCTPGARAVSRCGTSLSLVTRHLSVSWTVYSEITTSGLSNCCLMVGHWWWEERRAHCPSGTWLLPHQ